MPPKPLKRIGFLGWSLALGLTGPALSTPAPARAQAPVATCPPVAACADAPPPRAPHGRARHRRSALVTRLGPPQHRVLDRYLSADEPQVVVGKIAYASIDKDLIDEVVAVYVRPHCVGDWQPVGATYTTREDTVLPAVDGVRNRGGQVFFTLPAAHRLPVGRHAVWLRVAVDGTGAGGVIEVVAPGTPAVVVDLDGTLTPWVSSEATAFLSDRTAPIRPGAAATLQVLAGRGYRLLYLSTRPDWLTARARHFLAHHGAPPGVVQLAPTPLGELEIEAAPYKAARVAQLAGHGLVPVAALGDRPTDAEAYHAAAVAGPRFILGPHPPETAARLARLGARPVDDFGPVRAWAEGLPPATCPTPHTGLAPGPGLAPESGPDQGVAAPAPPAAPSGAKASDTPLMQ